MNLINNIKRAILNPRDLGHAILTRLAPFWYDDKSYLRLKYYFIMGRRLKLRNPITFNEKLQWLKLYNRKIEYSDFVDKYKVKQIVSKLIGEKYVIKTLGVWDTPEDIDFISLPNQFVLKTTHDGGSLGVVICKNKQDFDIENAKKRLYKSLKHSAYTYSREWPYKNVKRRIIAEEYIEDSIDKDLHDYKVLCFNGEPKLIEFHSGRHTNYQHQEFYDTDWNLTNISQGGPYLSNDSTYPKPNCLEELLNLSRILSKEFIHIRIDWYIINKTEIKFGEMTFFDGSGFDAFVDIHQDELLGSWINLNQK